MQGHTLTGVAFLNNSDNGREISQRGYYKRKIFLPFSILTDTWAVAKRLANDHRSRRFPIPAITEEKRKRLQRKY